MNPFPMVFADLRKNFLSGVGTLLLLAVAFSVNVAAGIFERGIVDSGARAAEDYHLVVGAPGSRLDLVLAAVFLRLDDSLPLLDGALLERIEDDPRVAASSPLVFSDGYQGMPIVGIGKRFPELRPSLIPVSGRWPEEAFETVVGASVPLSPGDEFRGSHGAEADSSDHSHDARYRVVGVLGITGTPWDRSILTLAESVWRIHEREHDAGHGSHEEEPGEVSAILVKPKDFSAAYALREAYRTESTTSAFPGEILAGVFGLFSDAKSAATALGLMLQILVLAAVVLSLLASLPAKYRWIGLLRGLGAGKRYIFLTLWLQSAVVFLFAGVVGLVAGRFAAEVLASAAGARIGLSVPLSWGVEEVLRLAAFSLIGLGGAMVPAFAGFQVSIRKAVLGR